MGNIASQFATAFRDFATDGVASSGPHEVVKEEVRAIGPIIEAAINNAGLGALIDVLKATRSDLNADLAHPADTVALVYADAADANNDLYIKVGASGSGSWTLTTILHDVIEGAGKPWSDLSQAWAEGTLPGGTGTKSAKEHAQDAAASVASIAALEPTIARTQENQLDYFSRSQLYDETAITDNFFVNTTGGLNSNTDFAATEHIAWPAGVTQVTMSRGDWIAQYTLTNGAFVFVSGSNVNPNSANYTLTRAAGATHFRASIRKASVTVANFSVTPGSTLVTPRPSFTKTLNGAALRDGTVATAAIADDAVTTDKASFIEPGKNLFNAATTTANSGQGTGNVITTAGRQLSALIPITPGVTYTYTFARFRAVLDANLVNRGSPNSTDVNGSTSYTAVAGDAFMRLTFEDALVPTAQCEVGSTATGFEPFGVKLTSNILNRARDSRWNNKRLLTYGDSLTAQLEWQPEVAAELGLIHTAAGVGGRRISGASGMWVQATIDALPASQDAIIVLGLTNDWAASVPLGVLYTTGTSGGLPTITLNTNTNEVYGALNVMVQRLQARYPTARLILAAPPWSELPDRVATSTWAQDSVNLQGLTIVEYGDAMKRVAEWHGLPFIDFRETGINATNNETFMKNDGGWLHPNSTLGGPRMAEVAIGRLRDLEPLL